MYKSYKYRLTPTPDQDSILSQWEGATRWMWNQFLAKTTEQYAADKTFIWGFDLKKQIPTLKVKYPWLKQVPAHALQNVSFDINKSLKRSTGKHRDQGFPKFKCKGRSAGSIKIDQVSNHIGILDTHIKIPKIGLVKWKYHRPITGILKQISIVKDINHWYVSVVCEVNDIQITPIDPTNCNAVGIDLGISSFLIDNNGNRVNSPKFLKKKATRLKRYQRQVSRKYKGSKNRDRARIKLAKWHRDIRNARSDWLHKLSNKIVNEHDLICVEDLKTKSLMKHKKQKSLNQAISDQGWGMFLGMLKYKSQRQGKTLTQINQYAPSSKACSCCGHVMSKMALDIREWECPNCSTLHDRDINAANNILFWGIMATKNTLGTGGINACGDTSADLSNQCWVSAKQEAACPLGPQ